MFRKALISVLFMLAAYRPASAGTISGNIITSSGSTIRNGVLTFSLGQTGVLAGTGTVVMSPAYCYTDTNGAIVGLQNPIVLPTVTPNTASGTLAAGIYYVKLTYWTGATETAASPEQTVVLSAQGSLIISAPALQIGSGFKAYIGTSPGTETLQGTIAGWTNFTQSTPLSAGSALPSSNTTSCSITFNDQIVPISYFLVNLTSSTGAQIPGFPQKWQLNGGASGTINVSQGAPLFNGITVYPQAIVAQPALNGLQSINGPLSLGANPFTAGNGSFSGNVIISGTLTGPTSFITAYVSSNVANPASSGFIRMAKTDTPCWRNNANSGDICVSKNASDQVVVPNGASISGGGSWAGSPSITSPSLISPVITTGVTSGSGFKHQRFTGICTTAASPGALCATTLTWASPFADTNYTAICTPIGATGGVGSWNISGKAAASLTFQIQSFNSNASSFASVDCSAWHD